LKPQGFHRYPAAERDNLTAICAVKGPRFAMKLLRTDRVSALFASDTSTMKTLAVIFLLALGAVAGSIYTDMLFTSAQADGSGELPMMHGQSLDPVSWR
jgi:hypothetical protein